MQLIDLTHLPIDRDHDNLIEPPGGGSSHPFIYFPKSGNIYKGAPGQYHLDMIEAHPELSKELSAYPGTSDWDRYMSQNGFHSGRLYENAPANWYSHPPHHEKEQVHAVMGGTPEHEIPESAWQDDPEPPTQPRNVQRVIRSYYTDFLIASGRFWEPADPE